MAISSLLQKIALGRSGSASSSRAARPPLSVVKSPARRLSPPAGMPAAAIALR